VRRALSLTLVAALVATGGCASWRAERAQQGRLGKELDALRYTRPIDEVWLEVRRLLAERGFLLAGADAEAVGQSEKALVGRMFSPARETRPLQAGVLPGLGNLGSSTPIGLVLETDWKANDRLRAEAIEDGGIRVILTRLVREGTDPMGTPSRERAFDLELELARRVDPAAAGRIEAAAASPSAR
jgi:hypothetical protein